MNIIDGMTPLPLAALHEDALALLGPGVVLFVGGVY